MTVILATVAITISAVSALAVLFLLVRDADQCDRIRQLELQLAAAMAPDPKWAAETRAQLLAAFNAADFATTPKDPA